MARSRQSSKSRSDSGNSGGGHRPVFHRGSEGRERSTAVREEQKARRDMAGRQGRKPLRFFVPVGDTKEIIIVDHEPEFFMYEHNLKLHGKWGNTYPCINEWEVCPACEEVGPSYYGLFLTVIDLTEFDSKDGTHHEFSRKIMVVKPSQHKKFIRDFDRRGTLRGSLYEVSRDGPKDPAIGSDIQFIETVSDDELNNDYVSSWTDREGKEHTENFGEEPLNYEEIMGDAPTADELRAMVGGSPPIGSRGQERKDLGGGTDGWDKDNDSAPWDDGAGKRSSSSSRRRNSSRDSDDGGSDDDDGDDSRSSRRSRTSKRSSGGSSDPGRSTRVRRRARS